MHVSVCSVVRLCLCLHLLFVLHRSVSVYRFANRCGRVNVCARGTVNALAAGQRRRTTRHNYAPGVAVKTESQMRGCFFTTMAR